jgi:hypothetical protein
MRGAARRGRGVLILVDAIAQDKQALQLWICAGVLLRFHERCWIGGIGCA